MLSRYLCRSSFARLAPETKRNYTDDYCLLFDFLWSRGKTWSDATADDLWAFEDWRTRSLRNPRRVGGARWNRGLAALIRLYEWAAQREHVMVNPVVMRAVLGRNGERVLVPAARAKNARSSEVRWLTPRAFRRWVEVGLLGYGADGVPYPGWSGRLADRNGAFADLLLVGTASRPARGTGTWSARSRSPSPAWRTGLTMWTGSRRPAGPRGG
ncbi:site-specific integrase [Streptomyces sp. MMS24-I31]|uniref:site-specific integrase n=1 Tax=Streptomyces sp. MMS24-I31 TaxID=3351563 RepID=UPI003896D056